MCQEEIPYCDWNLNPCENQGNCISTSRTDFTCECQSGYSGDNCNTLVPPSSFPKMSTFLEDLLRNSRYSARGGRRVMSSDLQMATRGQTQTGQASLKTFPLLR